MAAETPPEHMETSEDDTEPETATGEATDDRAPSPASPIEDDDDDFDLQPGAPPAEKKVTALPASSSRLANKTVRLALPRTDSKARERSRR